MSTTITGKLNKAANQFQAGEYTGFGIRLGKQYYDRDTQQKEWINYETAIFAKSQGQIDFYSSALVEGAVIEITAPEEKISVFEGNNGPIYSIKLLNATLGYVHNPQSASSGQPVQQQPAQQQQAQQQQAQQQAAQGFDDSIPF